LPDLHAVAIRLRDEGLGDHVIAVALEIEEAEVPILLHIADSKLTNLMAVDAVPYTEQSRRPARTNTFHANHQEGSS